jgi:hypothetical protein
MENRSISDFGNKFERNRPAWRADFHTSTLATALAT